MKYSTKDLIWIGMFAAVLAVVAQIQFPMPSGVPFTLQTFGVALVGCVLGWRRGLVTVLVYILLGAVGLPVFSGFMGGLGRLTGPTGGFIWGFLFLAALCGAGVQAKKKAFLVLSAAVGLLLCHLIGAVQFMLLSGTGFGEAWLLVSVPYLWKDIAAVTAAALLAKSIRKRLGKNGIFL